jgi:hypothetical protein
VRGQDIYFTADGGCRWQRDDNVGHFFVNKNDRFCIVYFALDHMYLIRRAVGGKAWRGQECRGLLAPWRAESFNLEEYLKKRLLDLDDRTQLIAKLHEAFRTQDGPVTSFKFT